MLKPDYGVTMIRTAATLVPIALMGCLNIEQVADNLAPDIIILAPNEGSTHDPSSVTFCAHIFDEDAIDQLDVTVTSDVDGVVTPTWDLCSGGNFGGNIVLSTEGAHNLTVSATDLALNNNTATISFNALASPSNPNTAPGCTFISPEPNASVSDDSLIAVEASVDDLEDALNELTVSLTSDVEGDLWSGAPSTDGSVITAVSLTTLGAQTLTLTVTDTEGLLSTCSVSISVDQP